MEKSKKNLRDMSIVILIFAAVSLIQTIMEFITDWINVSSLDGSLFNEGITRETTLIIMVVCYVLEGLLFIPQTYVGVKGLKVSKNPDSSKGYIVWAKILLILSIITIVGIVMEMLRYENIIANIMYIIVFLVDICVYGAFIKYANEVRAA